MALTAFAGCAGGPGGLGGLVASSTNVDFGDVAVGGSTSQLVTLTNTEKVNVKIVKVSADGKGFSVSGGSKVTLAPNQAVTVSVGFNPPATGKLQGRLSITSDASSGSLVRVALSGRGEASSKHSVALKWQPSVSAAIGYFIYRSTGGGALSKLNASLDDSPSFTDSTVMSGETYEYQVTSVNSANVESAASKPITVTIPNP